MSKLTLHYPRPPMLKCLDSLNVFVPAATICSILILCLWLPSRSSGSIITFAALYGLVSGE